VNGHRDGHALLEVRGMNRFFGGLHAVADVTFRVRAGQIKAVIGPNGAGKTTLFNLIAGSLRPSSGETLFDGRLITGLKVHQIAHRGIARTFQNIRLCPGMSVVENIMLGRHTRTRAGFVAGMFHPPWARREEKDIRGRAEELLDFFSLGSVRDEDALALPFGRQRAVEFARALAAEPRLLLLDEPASGLNMRETADLSSLICRIRELGITILLVEHDMSLVMEICDDILVLNYGRPIAEGTPQEVRKNPEVINIYLGEDYAQAAEY
jgi:branched-chain amino acid transport system ATP-binding protein